MVLKTNLNLMNMVLIVIFFILGSHTPFLMKFDSKTQNCLFKMNLGTKIKSKMLNSIVLYFFMFYIEYTVFG